MPITLDLEKEEIDELGIGLQAAIARHERRPWRSRARSRWALLIPAVLLVAVLALASLGAWQRGGDERYPPGGAESRGDGEGGLALMSGIWVSGGSLLEDGPLVRSL